MVMRKGGSCQLLDDDFLANSREPSVYVDIEDGRLARGGL